MAAGDRIIDASGNHLVDSAGNFVVFNASNACPECCEDAPASCPCDSTEWADLFNNGTTCGGLVQQYQIIDGPATSQPPNPSDPCLDVETCTGNVWDEILTATSSQCNWQGGSGKCWDGYQNSTTNHLLSLTGSGWRLAIRMDFASSGSSDNSYFKTTGLTPVGVYSISRECAAPQTLEVVEVV